MNKYFNKKCEHDGIKFDSLKERSFYLHLLENYPKEKIIIHPKFILQNSFRLHEKYYREIYYVSDFQIGMVVYDVKGSLKMITPEAKLKHKLFSFKYPQCSLLLAIKIGQQWTYNQA